MSSKKCSKARTLLLVALFAISTVIASVNLMVDSIIGETSFGCSMFIIHPDNAAAQTMLAIVVYSLAFSFAFQQFFNHIMRKIERFINAQAEKLAFLEIQNRNQRKQNISIQ